MSSHTQSEEVNLQNEKKKLLYQLKEQKLNLSRNQKSRAVK